MLIGIGPKYLGPSAGKLIHLFTLVVVNSITLFALSILLVRSIWSLASNTTTIEGWEIERHQALLRRARVLGGYLDGPDGMKVKIEAQEFPYDIGIWRNIRQGMGGSSNVSNDGQPGGSSAHSCGASRYLLGSGHSQVLHRTPVAFILR